MQKLYTSGLSNPDGKFKIGSAKIFVHFAKVYVYCISSVQDRFFLVLAAVSPTAEKYK